MTLADRIATGPDPETITVVARSFTIGAWFVLLILLFIILSKPRTPL